MLWGGVHALIERARTGDRDAWSDLHALVKGFLLSLARKQLRDRWPERSAHDLTQDAWFQFHKNIDSFRGGENDEQTGAMLRAWLGNTLTRLAKNYLRYETAASRKPPGGRVAPLTSLTSDTLSEDFIDTPAPDPTPSNAAWQKEQKARLERKITALADPLDQTVIRQFFFESRALKQIALELDETYDQTRYRFNRALTRLGHAFEESL